jgi:hypothetical protein
MADVTVSEQTVAIKVKNGAELPLFASVLTAPPNGERLTPNGERS